MEYKNILDLIGNTKIIPINRLNPHKNVKIYAKIESGNPGGSVKDRIALSMIEAAEQSGELTPDKTVLEATSGNTGIGLSMVCAVKGYRCQLVMPESASIERRKIMEAYGAEILLTPGKRGTDGAIERAYAMAREHPDQYFLADQFNNDANWMAHVKTTGPEIWQQTKGAVTDVVATLGTTGTVMGICRYFADNHPEVRVTAVEPFLGHKIQGLKNMKESYKPGIFDKTTPYQIINVPDEEAFRHARLLARKEGIFAGMSSGAAICAALAVAEQLTEGVIIVILPDSGDKYLSTELFTSKKEKKSKTTEGLRFFNTVSRKKEIFQPMSPNRVTFYACGPTAYEIANLGHCRRFLVADLIHRLLRQKGYNVQYYMNFTDLDDNTISGAARKGQSLKEFTSHYIDEYMKDMESLRLLPATGYPRASEHVDEMINIAHELIHKGYAYEQHGSVYFDISKFKKYGRLSRVPLDKIKVGMTVDLDDYEKNNPLDFTLMKRSTLAELKNGVFFQTDRGNMRPGWHIECAAMTLHYLGETMDIHTSGRDLLFPHHENENAIAESLTGKPLAKFWVHSELLLVEGRKMSPDNNNVITLRQLIEQGYSPRDVRLFLIRNHYRKPVDFSYKKLDAARTSLKRLDEFTRKLQCLPPDMPHPKVAAFVSDMEESFQAAMDDDMNVSKAIGAIFDFIKKVNPIISLGQLDRDQIDYIKESLEKINAILNVLRLEECPLAPEIDKLIQEREQARKQKNWARADDVRNKLAEQGITVFDTAKGPVWKDNDRD
ncbi:MAG: cysteine--tRNA ligase [Pseudomonadota bacterium]